MHYVFKKHKPEQTTNEEQTISEEQTTTAEQPITKEEKKSNWKQISTTKHRYKCPLHYVFSDQLWQLYYCIHSEPIRKCFNVVLILNLSKTKCHTK